MTIESGIENAGKGIWDLNDSYPEFDDALSEADDHLRGIKNCIKNTFPYLTGEVKLTDAEVNRGSVPVGVITTFWLAAAPSGWVRTTLPTYQYLLRIIEDSAPGGGSGGSDNPILMDKVPSHTHTVSGNTASGNATHTHTTTSNGAHTHTVTGTAGTVQGGGLSGVITSSGTLTTSSNGAHTHTAQSATAAHLHAISLTTAANSGADSWAPRYLSFILCTRSAITHP